MLQKVRRFFTRHKRLWLASALLLSASVWSLSMEADLRRTARYISPDAGSADWEEYRPHPTLFWCLRPYFKGHLLHSEYACSDPTPGEVRYFNVSLNSLGMRCPEFKINKSSGQQRILCLGDEITFGYNVDDDQSYPSHLQKALLSKGKYQVLNAGCPGWSSYQGREWLRLVGHSLKPDLYIIGFSYADSSPEDKADSARVLRFSPWNWLQDKLYGSELYLYLYHRQVKTFNPYGLPPANYQRNQLRVPQDEYRQNLQWFASLAESDKAKVVFLNLPYSEKDVSEMNSDYRKIMKEVAKSSGAIYIDLQSSLHSHADEILFSEFIYPNAKGYKQIAETIYSELQRCGWLGK